MTLPVAIDGHDIIGQAKTGTGKTLGFGIPLLHRVLGQADPGYAELDSPGSPQALVIVPTRELAGQVAQDLKTASSLMNIRILTVYGGRAYEPQVEALKKGIEVVVGTPGRLLDLAQQGLLKLGHVRTLVLDEADEMLDLGFLPDVEKLMSLTPDGRQTMLFSATMPGAVVNLARKYMTQPTHIRASDPTDTGATVLATAQFIYRAHAMDKVEMVARLLQSEGRGLTIIFTRTKRTAAKVSDELAERGFAAAAIHGDLGQGRASRRCVPSATARWTSWSPPMWLRAASTSRTSRTWSITAALRTRRPTCTGSAAPAGPVTPASPSLSWTGTTCIAGR